MIDVAGGILIVLFVIMLFFLGLAFLAAEDGNAGCGLFLLFIVAVILWNIFA